MPIRKYMNGPFVIVGMHRSGTSLVSQILDRSGVFMGSDLQEDHESKFFIGLNKWIYENAGADWARPLAVQELMDYKPAKKKVEEYLRLNIYKTFEKSWIKGIDLDVEEHTSMTNIQMLINRLVKDFVIDKQGSVSKAVYYLNKGIFSMEYNKSSNIYIRDFIFANSPALVYPSFFLNEPSRYSIRALTDCVVWELSKENFEIGKKKIPNLRIIAFKITNLFHQNIEKRFESLITQTPEERYIDLVKNHYEIINSIKLKDIASYLGINAVTLSRIRSRIAKKGIHPRKLNP